MGVRRHGVVELDWSKEPLALPRNGNSLRIMRTLHNVIGFLSPTTIN